MTNKGLAFLGYIGTTVFILDIVLTAIWMSKNDSSDIEVFFTLGCFISTFLFGYALSQNGKKSIFIPALVITLLAGIYGIVGVIAIDAVNHIGG